MSDANPFDFSSAPDVNADAPVSSDDTSASMATSNENIPAVPTAASTCPTGPATPSKNDIKGLQTALNRFFGVSFGSPIAVDGALGPATLAALNATMAWMPSGNYDPTGMIALIGSPASVASLTNYTVCISNLIDAIADDKGFTEGAIPSPSSASFVQTSHGKVPTAPIPTGQSNQIANNLLGLNFPNWWLYVGGVAFVGAIVWLIWDGKKQKQLRGLAGTVVDEGESNEDEGEADDNYDDNYEDAEDAEYVDVIE